MKHLIPIPFAFWFLIHHFWTPASPPTLQTHTHTSTHTHRRENKATKTLCTSEYQTHRDGDPRVTRRPNEWSEHVHVDSAAYTYVACEWCWHNLITSDNKQTPVSLALSLGPRTNTYFPFSVHQSIMHTFISKLLLNDSCALTNRELCASYMSYALTTRQLW